MFDITDTESFERVKSWVKELRRNAKQRLVIAIACNKSDLEGSRQVSQDVALTYATSIKAPIFSTSAKLNRGIEQSFIEIARKLISQDQQKNKSIQPNSSGGSGRASLTISMDDASNSASSKRNSSSCC